jgi:hypothetical protein
VRDSWRQAGEEKMIGQMVIKIQRIHWLLKYFVLRSAQRMGLRVWGGKFKIFNSKHQPMAALKKTDSRNSVVGRTIPMQTFVFEPMSRNTLP